MTMTSTPTSVAKPTATVALAGNPNVGKSTLFNALTGMHQHVGNWSGKTVARMEGSHQVGDRTLRLIDLPGTYSLSALSPEELIAREFIALERPDVVVNLVDAANLERNLYLTLQLLELTDKVVVVLNMMDIAEAKGVVIDAKALEARLGVPVVPMVAERRTGRDETIQAVQRMLDGDRPGRPLRAPLPTAVTEAIADVASKLDATALGGFDPEWFARKLLEGDAAIGELAASRPSLAPAVARAAQLRRTPALEDLEAEVIGAQYALLADIMAEVVTRRPDVEDWTDRIDRVVTHRLWGLPIMILVFGLMFFITFSLATPINDGFGGLLDQGGGLIRSALEKLGAPSILGDFMVDGLWAGFATVAGFFPVIAIFFTLFALLEDSGYLARAAFVVDRFMGAFGLHGRSFLPLLMGFGCNVPAVMAARIVDNRADRLLTILVNPLMLCQARLVLFVFFVGTFFTGLQATLAMLSLYAISVSLVLIISLAFKKTLFPGEPSPFIMELPPYHRPIARNVLRQAWRSAGGFLRRAATQITLMTGVIWIFTHVPFGTIEQSFAGILGHVLAPIGVPMGFDWRLLVSLVGGFIAKEGALASLAVIYGVGEDGLGGVLRQSITPLVAYSFMVVSLVYIPCYSTIVAIWRETLSVKWTAFSATYGLVLAFVLGTLIYQVGRLLGLG
ncbi:ferrous iron transport protein B [bacterium]|nr:ferrous iron transport protein B [bacterium]